MRNFRKNSGFLKMKHLKEFLAEVTKISQKNLQSKLKLLEEFSVVIPVELLEIFPMELFEGFPEEALPEFRMELLQELSVKLLGSY